MELSERNLKALHDTGYETVYEVFDEPNTIHPSYSHKANHEIIITEGSMLVATGCNVEKYKVNDRFTISADTKYFVKIGPNGCKYVIGG